MIEESLQSFLQGDTALSSLIEERVYPLIQPQGGKQPCVVYTLVGTSRTVNLCAQTDAKVRGAFQIDSYAKRYAEAKQVAATIRKLMCGFVGDMYGTRVSLITLETDADIGDPDPGLYRVSQQYFIWYTEK